MGNKKNATPAKEPKLMDEYDAENLLGADVGKPFGDRMIKLDSRIAQLGDELAQAKADRLFLDKQVRAAAKLVKSIDLGPVLTMKPYDDGLRAVLAKMKKGSGVTPWEEMKGGGTDEQIKVNMANGFGASWEPVRAAGHKISDARFYEGSDTYGGKVLLTGPALVAEVRRVLSIPLPPKAPPTKKPSTFKFSEPGAKETTTPGKGSKAAKEPAAPTKAQKKTAEVDALAKKGGGAVAPPAPPAADAKPAPDAKKVKPWGEWAKKVREALKRRGINRTVTSASTEWAAHHAAGLSPAQAVQKAYPDQGAGDEAAAPAVRVLVVDSAKPLDADTIYEAFDLGLSPGDVAAADQTDVLKAAGVPALTAVVQYGHQPYVVVRVETMPNDEYSLRPLCKPGTITSDFADPPQGRMVAWDGVEWQVGSRDDEILVKDDADAPAEPLDQARLFADVVELHNLGGVTWDAIRQSFPENIRKGEPAQVPAPVAVGAGQYLFVGIIQRDGRDVARLVELVLEANLTPAQIAQAKVDAKGYAGRTVQSPDGVRYVIAAETEDLLVWKPAAAGATTKRKVG